jgi:hypothetical protein
MREEKTYDAAKLALLRAGYRGVCASAQDCKFGRHFNFFLLCIIPSRNRHFPWTSVFEPFSASIWRVMRTDDPTRGTSCTTISSPIPLKDSGATAKGN